MGVGLDTDFGLLILDTSCCGCGCGGGGGGGCGGGDGCGSNGGGGTEDSSSFPADKHSKADGGIAPNEDELR